MILLRFVINYFQQRFNLVLVAALGSQQGDERGSSPRHQGADDRKPLFSIRTRFSISITAFAGRTIKNFGGKTSASSTLPDGQPSPVASQQAQSGPSSASALASYSADSAAVNVSRHRPLVPLFIKVFTPPTHSAPRKGTIFSPCSRIHSKVQCSTMTSHLDSSIGMPRNPAIRRICSGICFRRTS